MPDLIGHLFHPPCLLLPGLPRDILPALPDLIGHLFHSPSLLLPGLPLDFLPVLPGLSPRHARLRPGISSTRPASSSRACPGISFPLCPSPSVLPDLIGHLFHPPCLLLPGLPRDILLVMPGSDRASLPPALPPPHPGLDPGSPSRPARPFPSSCPAPTGHLFHPPCLLLIPGLTRDLLPVLPDLIGRLFHPPASSSSRA